MLWLFVGPMTPNSQTVQTIDRDWLKKWSLYSPHKIALKDINSNTSISYLELYKHSLQLAAMLKLQLGLCPGDRVAVLSKNDWRFIPLFFALDRIGAVLVPINYRLSAPEIRYILKDCEPKVLFLNNELNNHFEAAQVPIEYVVPTSWLETSSTPVSNPTQYGSESSPCMILYTSGTTGSPKGAMLTPQMLLWNSINTTLRLNLTSEDRHISFLPMFHTGGWNVLLTPFLHRGATTILIDKFDAETILQLAEDEKATLLFGVPTMLDMMAKAKNFSTCDLKQVRYAIVGGEPMPLPLIEVWHQKGVPIRQGYGLTEFGPNVFSLNEQDATRKIGSIGQPNFYIDTKLIDEQGQKICTPNQVGELALRGPTMMAGYWNNEKATAETIQDGWLFTGDLMKRDEEGYYYVVGRKKDMYISGGENVYPAEVEQALRRHPHVSEVAVIGIADAKWGEVGKAFVVLKADAQCSPEDLTQFAYGELARYKVPKVFEFVESLPKGDSGKILKRALR